MKNQLFYTSFLYLSVSILIIVEVKNEAGNPLVRCPSTFCFNPNYRGSKK